jgi:hypothetical protein
MAHISPAKERPMLNLFHFNLRKANIALLAFFMVFSLACDPAKKSEPKSESKQEVIKPEEKPITREAKAKKVFVDFFKKIGTSETDINNFLKYAEDMQLKENMPYIKALRVTLSSKGVLTILTWNASGQTSESEANSQQQLLSMAERRLSWFEMGMD